MSQQPNPTPMKVGKVTTTIYLHSPDETCINETQIRYNDVRELVAFASSVVGRVITEGGILDFKPPKIHFTFVSRLKDMIVEYEEGSLLHDTNVGAALASHNKAKEIMAAMKDPLTFSRK